MELHILDDELVVYQVRVREKKHQNMQGFYFQLIIIFHVDTPYLPFTEEHQMGVRKPKKSITLSCWTKLNSAASAKAQFELLNPKWSNVSVCTALIQSNIFLQSSFSVLERNERPLSDLILASPPVHRTV